MKTAIIIGATGLVGSTLVKQILDNPNYSKVTLLLRKPLDIKHPKLQQEIVDFDKPDATKLWATIYFVRWEQLCAKRVLKKHNIKLIVLILMNSGNCQSQRCKTVHFGFIHWLGCQFK